VHLRIKHNHVGYSRGGNVDYSELKNAFVAGRLGIGHLIFMKIYKDRWTGQTDKRFEIRQVEEIGDDDAFIFVKWRDDIRDMERRSKHSPAPVFPGHRNNIDIMGGEFRQSVDKKCMGAATVCFDK
tara:strand:- start:1212 stop:1589 length:378 start_codon:yes stop_codon:yes gene_type:complete